MNNLFIASSPMHILNAIIITALTEDYENNLVLCGRFKERNVFFFQLLESWHLNPFSHIFNLPELKHTSQIIPVMNKVRPDNVIFGNDRRPEFYALKSIQQRFGFNLDYMDDGLFSYTEPTKKRPGKFVHHMKNIVRKVVKGYTKPYGKPFGSSEKIKKAYLFFPEIAKSDIRKKECLRLDINQNVKHILSDLGQHAARVLDMKMPPHGSRVALYALPHQLHINSTVIQEIKQSLLDSVEQGMTVVLKNHPRNDEQLISELTKCLNDSSEIYVIPKDLPIEILIYSLQPEVVFSGISSIFLSCKAMSLNTRFELMATAAERENMPDIMQFLLYNKNIQSID